MNKFIGKMELFNMFLTLATRRRVVVASSSLHTAYPDFCSQKSRTLDFDESKSELSPYTRLLVFRPLSLKSYISGRNLVLDL